MIKINISENAAKKMAEMEEGVDDFTAMNPNHPNYDKPEEINYSWDLSTEEEKKD